MLEYRVLTFKDLAANFCNDIKQTKPKHESQNRRGKNFPKIACQIVSSATIDTGEMEDNHHHGSRKAQYQTRNL